MNSKLYNFSYDINSESIEGLITGQVDVIFVKEFYPKNLVEKFSNILIKDPRRGFFAKDNKISRVGMSHFDIIDN